jgi:hypothetical protein
VILRASIFAVALVSGATVFAQSDSDWLPLPDGPVSRIAFGSCAKHWQPQPIWDAVIAKKPDLFLFLGDNIYGDTDGTTAWLVSKGQMAGEWNRLADKPEFQKARAAFPFMATWDNHDYGSHAGGSEFPVKKDSKDVFLKFFDEPKDSPRWKRSGIYDAKINQTYGQALNEFRVGEAFVDLNFGLVEIDWTARKVSLSAVGEDGTKAFRETIEMTQKDK